MKIILLIAIIYCIYFFFFKSFAYKLIDKGEMGVQVMKDIKDSNKYLSLPDAKNIVDNTPYIVSCGSMNYFKAKKFVALLNSHGAKAELIIHFFWQKKIKLGQQNLGAASNNNRQKVQHTTKSGLDSQCKYCGAPLQGESECPICHNRNV